MLQRRFGLEGTALKWADTYLRPRQFTVNVEKPYSLPRQLNYCVPQGSCAGPTYFNMYSSTIKDVIPPNISINGFADDHALLKNWLLKIPQDQTDAINQLEFTLSDIEKWMQMNKLRMNNSKTEFVVFYPSRLGQYVSCDAINVNGEAIKASSVFGSLAGSTLNNEKTHI